MIEKKQQLTHGCNMWVKEIPDPIEETALDPHVYEDAREAMTKEMPDLPPKDAMVSLIRMQPLYPNGDVTKHTMHTREVIVDGKNGNYPAWIYRRVDSLQQTGTPCMIFFHGGAFCAGSAKVVENYCRAVADLADIVVVNVEYHLAPEYKFPAAAEDCYGAVNWVADHAKELGIDPNKLVVGGDSAGGTLAIDCCLYERARVEQGELPQSRIRLEALLYPAVLVDHHKLSDFKWEIAAYELAPDDQMARLMVYEIGVLMDAVPQIYMGHVGEVTDPIAAPLHQESLAGLPRTFLALGEFDYLRLSGEAFGRKLRRDGVEHSIFLYKGMNHAFIDKIGVYPQAYDVAMELAEEIIRLK